MSQRIENLDKEPDGLTVSEVIEKLRLSWRWLLGGAFVGVLGGGMFLALVAHQYDASAVIQPATVGMPSASNSTTKGTDVESASQTLERLKLSGFYNDDVLVACNVSDLPDPRQAIVKKMKPVLIKGNALIQISYTADSPKDAESCLVAIINQLTKVQSQIAAPIIKTLEEQRLLTKQQLADAEKVQSQIEHRMMTLNPSDAKFSSFTLMLGTALSKREEIARLRKVYNEQSLLLSEPMTQPVKLLEPIYTQTSPVYPKKMLSILIGLTAGIFLGALLFYGYSRHTNSTRSAIT